MASSYEKSDLPSMANSNESDMLTSSEDMTDDMHRIVHPNSKGKQKMFEPSEFTTPPETHESSQTEEVESNKGDKYVEWEFDTNKKKVPEVGQVFASEDEAYEFYNAYGGQEGFSIRKDKTEKRTNGTVYVRRFTCSRGGYRKNDRRCVNVKKRRAVTRTGCLARLVIKLNDDDTWFVKDFVPDHNHLNVTPSKTHLLRSQRRIQPSHVARIIDLEDVGVTPADGIELMAKEVGGKENLGITKVDYKNFVRGMRKMEENKVGKGEAQRVMDYFKRMQLENPSFFYAVNVNSVHQMTNFFWADARSIMDYEYFGDVVCFDTTYRTNKHSRPFAPFVGVNHHRQTILFGAALLLDETTESFVWLFKTFLDAMSGRKPHTIFTDQCSAMANALKTVMPDTNHRLCLWHIFQNAAKHLPYLFKDRKFTKDFKSCIYDHEIEEVFLSAWNQMLKNHKLEGDKWLEGLFKFRKNWALVYGHNTFCADMTTTQRSESINSMLKRFLKRKYSLPKVLSRYEKVLAKRREDELKADFDSNQTSPALYLNAPMLKQVAKVYTRETFEKFQEEFQNFVLYNIERCSMDGSIDDGSIETYKVSKIEGGEECLVTLDVKSNEVLCSYKKFKFAGIQCRHVIKVLNYNNTHEIPSQYILKRWTKDARVGVVRNNAGNPIQLKHNTSMGLRYGIVCRMAVDLATRCAVSEEAHLVAITGLEKVMEDVKDILKRTQVTTSHDSICKMNDGGSSMDVTLTLAHGNERGRPTGGRMKSCLERGRGRKRYKINPHGDNETNTNEPKKKKGRKGKSISVEGINNTPLGDPSYPVEVSTQLSQITTQEYENIHAIQEPYYADGLQQSSFLPYLGVLPCFIPSIVPFGGPSTTHVEPIRPTNSLGGHLPPPSNG